MNNDTKQTIYSIAKVMGIAIIMLASAFLSGKISNMKTSNVRYGSSHAEKLRRNKFAYMNR